MFLGTYPSSTEFTEAHRRFRDVQVEKVGWEQRTSARRRKYVENRDDCKDGEDGLV